MKEKTKRIIRIAVAALIGILLAFFLIISPALSIPIRDSTPGRMQYLFTAIEMYYYLYGEYPKGENRDIIKLLQNPPKSINNKDGSSLLGELRNKKKYFTWGIHAAQIDTNGNYLDSWGRPIKINIIEKENKIIMKSFGNNGQDDQSGADDIVMEDIYPPKQGIVNPLDFRERNGPEIVKKK